MHYLYLITNVVNWKQYVGITIDPRQRWRVHRNGWGSKVLRAAIAKYGVESFRFAVIHQSSDRACVEWMEQKAIAELCTQAPCGYNLSSGGECSAIGCHHSEEANRMKAARQRGQKHSPETRQRLKAAAKGRRPPGIGLPVPEEVRKRIADAKRGKPCPDATREANQKPVMVAGAYYASMLEAARCLNRTKASLYCQFARYKKNHSFPEGWGYVSASQRVS